jgi:hypothetical protein
MKGYGMSSRKLTESTTGAVATVVVILIATAALSGCSTGRLRSQQTLTASGPVTVTNADDQGLIGRFSASHELARRAVGTAQENACAQDFLDAGLALTEVYCDDFMFKLGALRQNNDALYQGTALAGTTAATILAAASASQPAIALTSAGFTTALAGIEVFQNVYLFAPDISAVQSLVDEAMSAYVLAATAPTRRATYGYESAFTTIRGAQTICEVQSIRHLVNEAVKAGTVQAFASENIDSSRRMIDGVVFAAVADALGSKGKLDDTQIAALYWLYRWNESPLDNPKYGIEIYKVLQGAATVLPVTDKGARNDKFEGEGRVRSALAGLSAPASRKAEEWIVATKKRLDTPATDSAAHDGATPSRRRTFQSTPTGSALPSIQLQVY